MHCAVNANKLEQNTAKLEVETRKISRHIDMHATPVAEFITVSLCPLTMHAELLSWGMCAPTFVLIAKVVFLLERGHTHIQVDKVTDTTDHHIHAHICRWRRGKLWLTTVHPDVVSF